MLQNTAYVIRLAWERKRNALFVMITQCLLTPAIPVVAMFLPATVVAIILGSADATVLVITVLAFTIVTAFLHSIKRYLFGVSRAQRNALRHSIIHDILDKTLTTDYANLEKKEFTDSREKAHNTTGSPNDSVQQIFYVMENFGANLIGFTLYIILLVRVNPLILLLTAATATAGFFVRLRANKWRHDNDDERSGYDKRTRYIVDAGSNTGIAKDIRLFEMIYWLRDVYNTYIKLRYNWQRKMEIRLLIADVTDCVATFLRDGAAYALLIWMVLFRDLPVDQFVLLFAAIGGFSGWVMGILNEFTALQKCSLDYSRLREFLEFPNSFRYEDGDFIEPQAGKSHSIELRGVRFRYSGAEDDTLRDINLCINAGEKLAIVGLNGAGKTTLVKLICGFYDPTEGEILLDGKDIREFNRKQYYSLFTAVFQEFNILAVTIAETVAGTGSDEIDIDRVISCLKLADSYSKVSSLPDGLNTLLGKEVHMDATELSGGEMQRLMLARALYKDAPVLILDEPTAALDPIAESRLYDRYNELSAGKTSLYISHRLASTRFCDRVIFIDDKTITEAGSHDELLLAGRKYADLFELQSKYYREEVETDAD